MKAGQESKPEGKKVEREAAKVEAPKRKASKREARRRRKALKRGEKALKYGREALRRERRSVEADAKRKRRELAKRKVVSEELTQELREITGKLQAACAASPDGYVTRGAGGGRAQPRERLPASAEDGMVAQGRSRREAGRYRGAAG